MKKILKLAAVGVSAFMLCSYIGQNNYVQPSAVEQTDIDDAEKEQQQVQNKIDNLQKELDSLASDITDTENYISQLDTKLAGYTSQLVECQGKIDAKQTEIDAKKQQIADKQAEIDSAQAELDAAKETEKEQYEAMKLRIQYMYECGDSTFLDMIFSAEDLSDMLGKAEYRTLFHDNALARNPFFRLQLELLPTYASSYHECNGPAAMPVRKESVPNIFSRRGMGVSMFPSSAPAIC